MYRETELMTRYLEIKRDNPPTPRVGFNKWYKWLKKKK